jgi:hypothetical protein
MKVEANVALGAIADIDQQIADQERSVAAISEAATINARAALTEFPAPTLDADFAGLLRRTLDDIARDAEQQLADHLASHGVTADGAEWIATGVEYARGGDCPFCGQNIRGLPLVACPCSKAHLAKKSVCRRSVRLTILDYSNRACPLLRSGHRTRVRGTMAVEQGNCRPRRPSAPNRLCRFSHLQQLTLRDARSDGAGRRLPEMR